MRGDDPRDTVHTGHTAGRVGHRSAARRSIDRHAVHHRHHSGTLLRSAVEQLKAAHGLGSGAAIGLLEVTEHLTAQYDAENEDQRRDEQDLAHTIRLDEASVTAVGVLAAVLLFALHLAYEHWRGRDAGQLVAREAHPARQS